MLSKKGVIFVKGTRVGVVLSGLNVVWRMSLTSDGFISTLGVCVCIFIQVECEYDHSLFDGIAR